MKVRDFHDEVWRPRCVKRLRVTTLSSYEVCWNNHIKPNLGDMELDEYVSEIIESDTGTLASRVALKVA